MMTNGTSIRIMVVEDQPSMRTLVRSSLRQIGYDNVVECENGEVALKEFIDRPAQLVISDLNMPKLDGLGLLRAVRGQPGLEKTPFIMLTSRGEVNIVMKAVELKVNNYLVKPFTLVGLKRKIEDVLGPLS
jgi:two-component system chemotaxis response regulator CheY